MGREERRVQGLDYLFTRQYLRNFVFFLYKRRKKTRSFYPSSIVEDFSQKLKSPNSKIDYNLHKSRAGVILQVTRCPSVAKFSRSIHCDDIVKRARKRLHALRVLRKSGFPSVYLFQIYCSLERPILEFASLVWAALPACLVPLLEGVKKSALRIIFPDC